MAEGANPTVTPPTRSTGDDTPTVASPARSDGDDTPTVTSPASPRSHQHYSETLRSVLRPPNHKCPNRPIKAGHMTVHRFQGHIDQHCGYLDCFNRLPIRLSCRPAAGWSRHWPLNKPLWQEKTNMFFTTTPMAISINWERKHLSPGSSRTPPPGSWGESSLLIREADPSPRISCHFSHGGVPLRRVARSSCN